MLLKEYHKYLNTLSKSICDKPIDHLCKLYRDVVKKQLQHHGRKHMVNYMKDLNSIAERYSLYQPIKPIKFRKSDKDGFPNEIRLFKPYLRNADSRIVKMTLSIFRSVEMMRLPPDRNIESVTSLPTYSDSLVKDITLYIPKFVNKLSKFETKNIFYHFTTKNGPNGPALSTSDTDFGAVATDDNLIQAIKQVSKELNDDKLPDEMDYNITTNYNHSKISQFSEKSGKTRTIAVVDYYSQRALRPLHDALMSILRRLPSDGTFSHNNVGIYVKEATSRKCDIVTSDMTAFTDRFPAIIQYNLLKEIVKNDELTEAWYTLLARREFYVPWLRKTVKYGTGQPMGAYASWALCTLAHHLIVHYSAYKVNVKDVNKLYRIIGDDNAITNKVLAAYYKETLTQLGCEINPYKSTSSYSGTKYSGAEVAKKLYLNGIDMSPLTPGQIKDMLNPYLLNSSIRDLSLSFDNTVSPIRLYDALYGPQRRSKRDKAWVFLTNPYDGVVRPNDLLGSNYTSPWASYISEDKDEQANFNEELFETAFEIRYNNLMSKMQNVNTDPKGFEGLWVRLSTEPHLTSDILKGISESDGTTPQWAVVQCAKHVKQKLNESMSSIMLAANDYNFTQLDEAIKLTVVEYIPDPTCPFKDVKELRKTQTSCLIESCYQELIVR